jgi:ATP-dependent protease ClpP protease subunit
VAWIRNRPWNLQATEPRSLVLSPRTACFDGKITKESVAALKAWAQVSADPPNRKTLVVRSRGGDAAAALNIAELLQRQNATVRVVDVCGSSCADFFFAGIRNRSVTDGALILFHGGFSAQNRTRLVAELDKLLSSESSRKIEHPDQLRTSALEEFDEDTSRQNQLYDSLGVDRAIVRDIENIDVDRLPESDCDPSRKARRNFVFFDLQQLEALGLSVSSGKPATTPSEVNRRLVRLGADFEACRAPAWFGSARPLPDSSGRNRALGGTTRFT